MHLWVARYVTIESANPTNEHIMIFVNKERIRYNPKELHHGDHILFGTRHIFQYINPMENAQLGLGLDEEGKSSEDAGKMEELYAVEKRMHRKVVLCDAVLQTVSTLVVIGVRDPAVFE